MEWIISIGYIRNRGGWFITGEHIVKARDYNTAHNKGQTYCDRSERVLDVREAFNIC
jgi:hypothetical protein